MSIISRGSPQGNRPPRLACRAHGARILRLSGTPVGRSAERQAIAGRAQIGNVRDVPARPPHHAGSVNSICGRRGGTYGGCEMNRRIARLVWTASLLFGVVISSACSGLDAHNSHVHRDLPL
jgi:hypothetical protein